MPLTPMVYKIACESILKMEFIYLCFAAAPDKTKYLIKLIETNHIKIQYNHKAVLLIYL